MKITYELAMAAGKDAANKQMKAAGRSAWNEDDYSRAAELATELLASGNFEIPGSDIRG